MKKQRVRLVRPGKPVHMKILGNVSIIRTLFGTKKYINLFFGKHPDTKIHVTITPSSYKYKGSLRLEGMGMNVGV